MTASLSRLAALPAAALLAQCAAMSTPPPTTLADDVAFLEAHADALRFDSGTGAFVVSPALQGRIMTAAVTPEGDSLGFVHRAAIRARDESAAFHNHGGVERFWVGPESGPYALFFDPGVPHERELWRVPEDLDTGAFAAGARSARGVTLTRTIALRNAAGTRLRMDVQRRIEAPGRAAVEERTGPIPAGTPWTAYRSRTQLRNAGERAWTRDGGLPCIWILGMFRPGPDAIVVAPFRPQHPDPDGGPPVRSDYFGQVPPERFRIGAEAAVFRADAREEGKIGVLRNRARDVLASWDPDARILTLVYFGPIARQMPYLNEQWGRDLDEPYYGDVANSYNADDGAFYELESSSPALALAPGEGWSHESLTVHLRLDDDEALARFASRALGLDWTALPDLP